MSNKNIEVLMKNVVVSDELKDKIRQQTIDKDKVVKYRRINLKKVILVACLCVALLGMMSVVVAKNSEKLEKYFAKILNIDDETQKKLEEGGFYQDMNISHNDGDIIEATHDGITVTVKETIADKSTLRFLVQVTAEEGVNFDEDCYFEDCFVEGIPHDSNMICYASVIGHELDGKWYVVSIVNYKENGIKSGDIIDITFKSILKTSWNTEMLCEIKDGATGMIDGEEYVVKRVGHMEEVEDGKHALVASDHWSFIYENIFCDVDENAYVFVRVSDGKEYPGDNTAIEYRQNGDAYLLERLDNSVETEVISDAEWNLKWELTANEDYITIPVNETIEVNNSCYYIDNVEITPFSVNVIFSKPTLVSNEYTPLKLKLFMKDGSVREMKSKYIYNINEDGEWYGCLDYMELDEIEKISIEGKEYFVGE